MKIKGILLATISLMGISGAFAQGVEYDDMYFNAEDRAKLNAQRSTEVAFNTTSKSKKFNFDEEESVNPTDSYSARNVNPEYTSRAHTQTAQEDEQDYFVNNYQYNKSQYNDWNNNYNQWYSSPWYRTNYYGPAISNWNSPYYGYSSWNSPWYDPMWAHNGWSSSFSFRYGRSWDYGWGGNYNYWNRPYYGWGMDPYFGGGMNPYFGGLGYYGGGYWNNWRYPGTIIIVDGERGGRNVVRGKRPTRGATMVSNQNSVRSRSSVNSSSRNEQNSSGRVSTSTSKQQEYYNRTRSTTNSSSYGNRSNTQYNRSRSWDSGNSNNNSWNNNRSIDRSSTPSYSPSRSSSSGAGTRTNTGGSSSGRRGRD